MCGKTRCADFSVCRGECEKYFGNGVTKEKVREYFRPTIKFDESGKGYAPLIKTKLSKSRVKVWTPAEEAGNVEDIQSHSQMSVALLVRALLNIAATSVKSIQSADSRTGNDLRVRSQECRRGGRGCV